MKHLKKRNILTSLFTLVLISVFIIGCGNDKKETGEVSGDSKYETKQTKESPVSQNTEHININLPTVQCGMCKKTIETAVKKMDGIASINVDKTEKVAHIDYDKSKTDLAKIEAVIVSAGYNANDKKADPDAYAKLDDCCKLPEDQKESK